MRRSIPILWMVFTGCTAVGRTPIVVPPEAVREWAYGPEGTPANSRYVVRMTDGRHEWEVEFPETAYGSEVRVPLRAGGYQLKYGGDQQGLTPADREIQEEERRTRKATPAPAADPMYGFVDEPLPKAKPAAPAAPAGKPGRKQSYLVGRAQIKQLYESRNYEIALVQLVDLEKDYPNDETLLAMKGSIYRRLGKTALARQAWERVLALNPDNQVVASALRQLAEEEERANDKGDKSDKNRDDDSGEGGR